ncbi:hypothetical protein [Anaerocolumna sp. MB42-C2]|uniref:hypothetical protein n=1 Tax=Anaerocolumna sp. MB42-C2 TaxID=3070997 RepID=UPI0027E0BBC2|nr:hypothetical protein [Anaerocolumna sp. MB42-C2]WMJ88883.1 hypothetical protein RBU59_05025 [Anaerocolumna sp. MB42-C2]
MTEKELSHYKALKARLERNEIKLEKLRNKDIPIVNGKVKGSSKSFPYIETHYNVQMYEPKEMDECSNRIHKLEKSINEDKNRIQKIEDFINLIDDPELQLLFEMRVYEKMGWIEIATELDEDKDRTTYSKRFRSYIINSHNSPISQ